MNGATKRPSPASVEALDLVFEMAEELTGCMSADDQETWFEWLDAVRAHRMPGDKRRRRCSSCGAFGHRATTCALNPDRVEVAKEPYATPKLTPPPASDARIVRALEELEAERYLSEQGDR